MFYVRTAALCAALALLASCSTPQKGVLDLGETGHSHVDQDFDWPVYGAVVTQKFRPVKRRPYRRIHQGIDLAAPKNTPIHAVNHGRVVYAGHGYSGYGRLVIVEHMDQRYQSYYAHLSRYKVNKGDIVKRGDIVGLMGSSGRSTGVHLHFELRENKVALDPLSFLPKSSEAGRTAAP